MILKHDLRVINLRLFYDIVNLTTAENNNEEQ